MIIGLGTDIVEISRIKGVVHKHPRFVKRILSVAERELYENMTHTDRKYAFLAGRFAVKEAYAKALGTGIGRRVRFNEIVCLNEKSGQPYIEDAPHAHVSISHAKHYATATVILTKEDVYE